MALVICPGLVTAATLYR